MKKIILLCLIVLIVLSFVFVVGCGPKCRTVTKSVKGCDNIQGCECLHKSWAGLGACDSCKCKVCE